MTPERARLARGLALLTTLVLAVLLFGWQPAAPQAPAGTPEPTPRPLRRAHVTPPTAPAPTMAAAPTPRQKRNATPTLASATLDRTLLCPGESTFLRMDGRDADDDDLRYQATLVSATLGTPRFGFGRWIRIDAPPEAGRYQVIAAVEDPARARAERALELRVETCDAPAPFDASQLRIQHEELDAAVHELSLSLARDVARRAGKTLEVVRWQFGDGSSGPGEIRTRHSYPIEMGRRHSYYLVTAEVSLDGEPARVEYGLSTYSYAAANLQAGYVALAADVERGDDSDDVVSYVVTFSNVTPYSALARELELTCLDAAGVPQARWREPLDLGVPGESSLEQTLQLDRRRCPGGASYELFGEADGGYAVGGLWSYKLRPSAPAGDARQARERARRVLGVR